MTDHRRIQRTLFRMLHDGGFAERLRARDAATVATTGLGDDDLGLLLAAPAAALEADAGGKRRAQFLGNVSSEHRLTVARALSGPDASLLEAFTSSARFHDAIAHDRPLPLAFGEHALERAARSGDALLLGLAEAELAMARARRSPFRRNPPPPGGIVLSSRAEVIEIPEGTIEAAGELRRALDAAAAGDHAAGARLLDSLVVHRKRTEHALVLSAPRPSPHRLADVALELLSPLAGSLVMLARDGATPEALAAFCTAHEATPAELDDFVAGLVDDGVIERG